MAKLLTYNKKLKSFRERTERMEIERNSDIEQELLFIRRGIISGSFQTDGKKTSGYGEIKNKCDNGTQDINKRGNHSTTNVDRSDRVRLNCVNAITSHAVI